MPGRTDLTDTVSLSSGGGGTDNVISGLTLLYSSEQLLVRALKSEGGEVNSNAVTLRAPADWARANGRSGRAPDAAIPTGVARDGELPSDIDLSESDGDLTVTVTRPGRSALTDTVSLPVFDLHDDVPIPVSALVNSDRFLVSAEDVTGDPNRFVTVGDTVEFIRADVRDESVSITTNPRIYNFTGGGVTATNNNGLVTITIPGGGGGADDGVIDDFEAVLNGNDIDFTVGRTVGDDLTESVTVGHPSRLYLAPDISYGGTNNRDVMIDQGGYVPVEGDIVIFQHNTGAAANYSTGESIRLAIGNATPLNTRIQEGASLREVRFSDITRYNILGWYRGGNNFQLIYKTYQDAIFEIDDEGSELTTHTSSLNFVGAGVTAAASGTDVTITIPGGGGTQTGSVEVLHDTFTTGAGVTLQGNASAWESAGMFTLTRAIVEADDPGNIRIFGSYTADSINKYFEFSIPAALFRRMDALTTAAPTNNARNSISFHIQRTTASALTGWSESILHTGRGRASGGNDEIWFNFGGANGAATVFRMRAELVVPGGGSGGGGLIEAQVDARVRAGVQDFAEAGNIDRVPGDKLGISLGTGEFLYAAGGDQQEWRTIIGALSGETGDHALVIDGGTFAAVAPGSTGDVLTRTAGGFAMQVPSTFDLHEDVATNEHTAIRQADRFLLSAEEESGDPNTWTSFATLEASIRPAMQDEGTEVSNRAGVINCTGAGITCSGNPNTAYTEINVPGGGGGGGALAVQVEGTELDDDPTALNFTGAVTGTGTGTVTVDVDPFEGATQIGGTGIPVDVRYLLELNGVTRWVDGAQVNNAYRTERGLFDNTVAYSTGNIVETGTGDLTVFWTASRNISAGQGAPTSSDPGYWWNLASHGFFRGELDTTVAYDLFEGDTYHVGDLVFAVTSDESGVTGDALLGIGVEHVIEISDPLLQDEGTAQAGFVGTINCVGTAITCTLTDGVAELRVPSTSRPLIQYQGNNFHLDAQVLNFTGAGVTLTSNGSGVNIAVPGGVGSFALSGITTSPNVLTGSDTFLHAASGSNTPNERTTLPVIGNWLTSNMNPPRSITRGPRPALASANVSRIYSDGASSNDALAYLRDGTESEIDIGASNLRLDWTGFASRLGVWHTGGTQGPVRVNEIVSLVTGPDGVILVLSPQTNPNDNALLGATRSADPATIDVEWNAVDSTTTVSKTLTRGNFGNNVRAYQSTNDSDRFTAGRTYEVRFQLPGSSTDVNLHTGDHFSRLASDSALDQLRIELEHFSVEAAEGHIVANPAGAATEALSKIAIGRTIFGIEGTAFGSLPDIPSEIKTSDLVVVSRGGNDYQFTYAMFVDWLIGTSSNLSTGLSRAVNLADQTTGLVVNLATFDRATEINVGDWLVMHDVSEGTGTSNYRINKADFVDDIADQDTLEEQGGRLNVKDGSISRDHLKVGVGNQTDDGFFTVEDYAFIVRRTSGSADCFLGQDYDDTNSKSRWRWFDNGLNPSCDNISSQWKYMASSDNPSVWVLLKPDGLVGGMWEAEDPPSSGPALWPPEDADGVPLPGYTVLDIGLPTFSVIEQVYSVTLAEYQRTVAMQCSSDYFLSRGWIAAPWTIITDTLTIPSRYEPSSRQWLMRCMADAAGVPIGMFYTDNLVVAGSAWAMPN